MREIIFKLEKFWVGRIRNLFYVKGESGIIYEITRDLVCNCKGYVAHKKCKHQGVITKYCEEGGEVDLARQQSLLPKTELLVRK